MDKIRVLLTGGAGFIGSTIAEALLKDERVEKLVILDNFSTGNIENVLPFSSHSKYELVNGDIRDYETCLKAASGCTIICHQAALGSVPRSIQDPKTTHDVNITGTLHLFLAAKENNIRKIIYASSSSVYGDHESLPKKEGITGRPLSPYAVSKKVNEHYADLFSGIYDIRFIGFRYFNIFGPKQSPKGPYAAVIPLFISSILKKIPPVINGDGNQSRDFTYVENAVQANLKAIFCEREDAWNQVYNIASGQQTTINELYRMLCALENTCLPPVYGPVRPGDVLHSLADTGKVREKLGYNPKITVEEGLHLTYNWHKSFIREILPEKKSEN